MESATIGKLITGFGIRALGLGLALYVGLEVASYIADVYGQTTLALESAL